jgi:hypothetical protein
MSVTPSPTTTKLQHNTVSTGLYPSAGSEHGCSSHLMPRPLLQELGQLLLPAWMAPKGQDGSPLYFLLPPLAADTTNGGGT